MIRVFVLLVLHCKNTLESLLLDVLPAFLRSVHRLTMLDDSRMEQLSLLVDKQVQFVDILVPHCFLVDDVQNIGPNDTFVELLISHLLPQLVILRLVILRWFHPLVAYSQHVSQEVLWSFLSFCVCNACRFPTVDHHVQHFRFEPREWLHPLEQSCDVVGIDFRHNKEHLIRVFPFVFVQWVLQKRFEIHKLILFGIILLKQVLHHWFNASLLQFQSIVESHSDDLELRLLEISFLSLSCFFVDSSQFITECSIPLAVDQETFEDVDDVRCVAPLMDLFLILISGEHDTVGAEEPPVHHLRVDVGVQLKPDALWHDKLFQQRFDQLAMRMRLHVSQTWVSICYALSWCLSLIAFARVVDDMRFGFPRPLALVVHEDVVSGGGPDHEHYHLLWCAAEGEISRVR
jgi:hypothetical protein